MQRWVLAILVLVAGVLPAAAEEIRVDGGVARAATPAARAIAGYMRLVNESGRDDRLLDVRVEGAAGAMLHASVETEGTVRMTPAPEGFPLPADGELVLAPGGRHVMIHGPAQPLEDGAAVDLVLVFEQAGAIAASLPLRIGPAHEIEHGD